MSLIDLLQIIAEKDLLLESTRPLSIPVLGSPYNYTIAEITKVQYWWLVQRCQINDSPVKRDDYGKLSPIALFLAKAVSR